MKTILKNIKSSEMPYISLLSHLFSDRLLIIDAANTNSISKEIDKVSINNSSIKKSIWIIADNDWAQNKGFCEINNLMAMGIKDVNILIFTTDIHMSSIAQIENKDLGAIAMTYKDVYVASVAIGADQEQVNKAFVEAENHNKTSFIIAFNHNAKFDVDINNIYQYDKDAVKSGYWLLYRNNPQREDIRLNTLQLDSNVPSINIHNFIKHYHCFTELLKKDRAQFNILIHQLQKQIDKRFDEYLAKSSLGYINRSKLLQNNKMKQQLTYRGRRLS